MIGQGIVLMVAGMGIVYVFLYLLIVVSEWASQFVSRFDYMVAGCKPKKAPKRSAAHENRIIAPSTSKGIPVTSPIPGTVLRLSASDGQDVSEGEEILVIDVMKMETPITAPCSGRVSMRVAAMDKVATGDIVAVIE